RDPTGDVIERNGDGTDERFPAGVRPALEEEVARELDGPEDADPVDRGKEGGRRAQSLEDVANLGCRSVGQAQVLRAIEELPDQEGSHPLLAYSRVADQQAAETRPESHVAHPDPAHVRAHEAA